MGPPSPGQRPGSEILGSGEMRRSSGFFSAVGPAAPSLLLLLSLLLLSPDRGGAEAEHQRGTIVNMGGKREKEKPTYVWGGQGPPASSWAPGTPSLPREQQLLIPGGNCKKMLLQ